MRFRSVRGRIVVLTFAVAAASIVLAASLVNQSTSESLEEEQRRSLEVDTAVYEALIDYAWTHPTWDGVEAVVDRLANETGRRVALTTRSGDPIADSAAGEATVPALPARPAATVDAASPSIGLVDAEGFAVVDEDTAPGGADTSAAASLLTTCLDDAGIPHGLDDEEIGVDRIVPAGDDPDWDGYWDCYEPSVRAVTAPTALLYLGNRAGAGAGAGRGPGALIVVAVAAMAALSAWWIGRRVTTPIDRLREAATAFETGDLDSRVQVRGNDELARLGTSFNAMADALQDQERARRQLIADVAHELGNPVVTMGGTIEALEEGIYQPDPDVIARLAGEAAQLRHLVADLQDLAWADAGALALHRDDVDLTALVAEVVDTHRDAAHRAGITLTSPTASPVIVAADAARLRQVVTNLIANSVQHTGPGDAVTVTVGETPSAVQVDVADSGPGIAHADLERVFDRFWRGDPARQRRSSGSTGLGLPIARTLARAHGGDVTAASTPGEGSTFTVTLPIDHRTDGDQEIRRR
jgi:two-component system sensor histidine kinase BaeS